jgi:hypothetical protein
MASLLSNAGVLSIVKPNEWGEKEVKLESESARERLDSPLRKWSALTDT